MAPYHHQNFQKPENALKRAEELLMVGQKGAALHALHDVITSRRHRTWGKTQEKIMMKYVELCVEMKRARFARDGLIQYRQVCQQVNVGSLEEVIKHYIRLATERAERAQMEADDLKAVKDLEEFNTPEELMLSYVTAESDADRHDRENVMPWFKFLWETYRNCLDILKNNSKLEALYNMTAHKAFHFCKQYKRTNEFRRVCDTIRNHLSNLSKYKDQRDRPDITQPDTMQLYLETRFEQLKVATELELWQEAFRSIEDIHSLMCLVRKTPRPNMLVEYYSRLATIFRVSGAHLYHANAWYRLYNLTITYRQGLAPADVRMMASSVLLAALASPLYDAGAPAGGSIHQQEVKSEKQARIATLLAFNVDPRKEVNRESMTRASMLAELVAKGFLNIVFPEVRDLYKALETDFRPRDLCARVAELLERMSAEDHGFAGELSAAAPRGAAIEIGTYVPSIQSLAALRQVQQVSSVYSAIRISSLQSMLVFTSPTELELLLVRACKADFINMKIGYQNDSVTFGEAALGGDRVKGQIAAVARKLSRAVAMIDALGGAPPPPRGRSAGAIEAVRKGTEEEHLRCLARKALIERRKEEQERELAKQLEEEEERKAKQQQLSLEAERKRLQLEEARREQERLTRELEEQDMEEARRMLAESAVGKKKGKKVALDADGKVDKRQLMEDALQEQIKERHESERKLMRVARQMDHYERASREEEAPILEEMIRESQKAEEAEHYQKQEARLADARSRWERDLEARAQMLAMREDVMGVAGRMMEIRGAEAAAQRAAQEEALAEKREMRRAERALARKREYLRRLRQQRAEEEEERRRREEERLEEKRREEEEEERRRREEESRRPGKFVPGFRRGGAPDRDREDYGPPPGRGDDRPPPRGFDDRPPPRGFDDRGGYGGPPRRTFGGGYGDREDSGRFGPRRGGPPSYGAGDRDRDGPPPPSGGGYRAPGRR